jgi:predicted acyltransferase (DUF342 family)
MILLDQIREKALIKLATDRFGSELTEAELKVLRDSATSEELPDPGEKAPRPEVRAAFLRWLATDPEAAPHIDPKGLRVSAAAIPGKLDLRECHVHPTLSFYRCDFRGKIDLRTAETRGLYFLDSSMAGGITADMVIVHGPLFLRNSQSDGEISLLGAEITDNLECNGAKLKAKGNALNADRVQIGGSVFMKEGFESEGVIRLHDAKITGQLNCSGAKLKAKGRALSADGVKIGSDVFLDDGFESEGEIRLLGAEITGQLNCNGAKLKAKGNALFADSAHIGDAVLLKEGFESEGEIRLPGAEITRELNCTGAKLKAKGVALSVDGAQIGGSVFLIDDFMSNGKIRLIGAEIGRDLAIVSAKVAAVSCKNIVITGDLLWQRIEKSKDTYLNLIGAKVKNLRDDRISWPGEGNLDIDGLVYEELTLHAPASDENIKAHVYAGELPLVAKERIAWLMLQEPDRRTEPQPWMQLRDLLERKGDRKGAKHVLFRFRCLQAQKSWILWQWWRIAFAWLEEAPIRILYPITITLLLGTLAFSGTDRRGAMIHSVREPAAAAPQISPVPKAKTDSENIAAGLAADASTAKSDPYPPFQPFVYTLENALPMVKLGMDDKWTPDAGPEFCIPWFPRRPWLYFVTTYGLLAFTRWLLIFLGWFYSAVLGAALMRRFKE